MLVIGLGAVLIIVGVVYMAGPPIWRERLSGRWVRRPVANPTLEPRKPASGFRLAAIWPGLVMVALGAILLLAGAAF